MAIQDIHKKAILKLINLLTLKDVVNNETSCDTERNENDNINNLEIDCSKLFREQLTKIDLSLMTRLGYLIGRFEKYFNSNRHTALSNIDNVVNDHHQQNLAYQTKLKTLVEYVETNELLRNKSIDSNSIRENGSQHLVQQQQSEHVQMLILLIRDWISKFYLDKGFIGDLFPSDTTDKGTIFSLASIKENNLFLIALFIFKIFYEFRSSFPEYNLLLEFSWLCFADLERYIGQASLDNEYIYRMLQESLLSAKLVEEKEAQINKDLYQKIEMLNKKILDTQKRILNLENQSPKTTATPEMVALIPVKPKTNVETVTKKSTTIQQLPNVSNIPNQSQVKFQTNLPSSSSRLSVNSTKVQIAQSTPITKSNSSKGFHSSPERPYKCNICSKSFPTIYKLNRHNYSHSGQRPFLCTWPNCSKRFNDNYHLKRHLNTHTGEKPYLCQFSGCSKRYSRSEDLRHHSKTHLVNAQITSTSINSNAGILNKSNNNNDDINNNNRSKFAFISKNSNNSSTVNRSLTGVSTAGTSQKSFLSRNEPIQTRLTRLQHQQIQRQQNHPSENVLLVPSSSTMNSGTVHLVQQSSTSSFSSSTIVAGRNNSSSLDSNQQQQPISDHYF
ncbi:serine palmitoyltransferase 2-like [Sarcoptes scabiei]|nr:serine palmitoyltransferase 2-like [Sarcoptes scabiei]